MLKKISLFLVLLTIFFSGCAGKEEKRDAYYKKGQVLFDKRDFVKAKLEFKNVLQIDPKFAPAYHKIGQCEKKLENWRKAFGAFSKAVELDPELWDAQLSLAEMFLMAKQADKAKEKIALVKEGRPENLRALLIESLILINDKKTDAAEKILRDVIEKDPEKTGAYLILANLRGKKTSPMESEKILKKGLQHDEKNPSLLLALAGLYTKEKKFSKAESIFQNLINYYPDQREYLILLARFYQKTDQPEKAEGIYQALIKKEPDEVDYRIVLARFYRDQKKTDKAIDTLKKAISALPEQLNLKLLLGELYMAVNKIDLSLAIYRELAKNYPDRPEGLTAQVQMARIYFYQEKIDSALNQLEMVLKENPRDVGAHTLRGMIFLSRGKGLEAVGEFRPIVQENPNDPEGYVYLARAHLLNKEKALALDNLKKALNINFRHQEALKLILKVYIKERSFDDGISLLKEISRKDPENLPVISRLGDLYLMKGDLEKAEESYMQIRERAPESPEGFIKMSLVLREKKDYSGAEDQLDRALALQPENLAILTKIIELQMLRKQPDLALKKCRAHMKQLPASEAKIRLLVSRIYLSLKKFGDAEDQIKQAIRLKPDWAVPYAAMGNLYLVEGKIDQGIEEFELALKKKPGAVNLKFMIGNLYEKKGDYDDALQWYTLVVDKHPKFLPGINNLTYLYADRFPSEKNLDRALELLSGIPEELMDPNTLDTMGWVYYQRKEFALAVKTLKQAEVKGSTPILQLHLGLAYLKMNQPEEARNALVIALKEGGRWLGKRDKELAEKTMKRLGD